jgi:hypothetical protein
LNRTLGDARQDFGEPRWRINAFILAVHHRGTLAIAMGAAEHPWFASQPKYPVPELVTLETGLFLLGVALRGLCSA